MGAMANIAAITAYNIASAQDNIFFVATAEGKFLQLQKTSTATPNNATVWSAVPSGRWHLLGSGQEILSTTAPSAVLPAGTKYFWLENNAANTYDSVISYISNGTAWIELVPRMRLHTDTPDSLSLTPNSDSEMWKDTTTGVVYTAFSGGWVELGSGGVS